MALSKKQSTLIGLLNQISQSLANHDTSTSVAGIDIDLGGNRFPSISFPSCPPTPDTPTTLQEVLLSMVNEQVQITTPFGAVTGTILSVNQDYVILFENSGDQVLIRIDKIEFISES